MERGCWCYSADDDSPEVASPPAERNGHVTFGSLNKIIKLSEPCARLWAQVLTAVPDARLLLSVASEQAADAVRERLIRLGLPPTRLDLLPKTLSRYDYLERFAQVDVALDTFPFNGITTSCDGLWMGVPLVSLAGGTTVSRAGQSILHGLGLPHLSTTTAEAFVKVATQLAEDQTALAELRMGMRQRMLKSSLMDHAGFTRSLEAHYSEVCKAWHSSHC